LFDLAYTLDLPSFSTSYDFVAVEFRGTRRIRLLFDGPLGSAAFTSTTYYAVRSDGTGPDPINVVAVFAVTGTPSGVELAVDEDWVAGTAYTITCTNVPCSGAAPFTGSLTAATAQPLANPPNVEPATNDLALLLYGRDLLHNGTDFVEDATGDLATVDGRDNFIGALRRRMTSNGLPWDDAYGTKADQYVDAPETQAQPFAGNIMSQARADDRTKQAAVDIVQDPSDVGQWAFELTVTAQDGLDTPTLLIPLPGN